MIIRHLLDACQDTRIRFKQELLTAKRLQYATFKQQEQSRKQFCKENNEPFIAKNLLINRPNYPTVKRF